MTDLPVIMVGFVAPALTSLAKFQPDNSVIIIEEPDVVRKREVRQAVADSTLVRELIEYEYQMPGAADEFVNARPDLHPAAVAPLQEYPTVFAARLAERYGLPGAGLGAAQLMRDKAQLRKVTAAAGIANPQSVAVDGPQGVREFMTAHPGPVVLKPANRQGAVGTWIVPGSEAVDEAWAECIQQDEGAMVPDRPIPVRMLAERFVRGEEYSVEMLVSNGRSLFANVTGKLLFPGPRPIELGHVVPADIPERLKALLSEQTERVLRAVGFGTGIVHCEWIVSEGTAYLVECAGRFPGDGIIELIDRAYPTDLVPCFWALMKGEPPTQPLPRTATQAAAVRFLHVESGEVISVDGLDEARAVPGVVSCEAMVKPGELARELRCSWDRSGMAIACGSTPTEAMAHAEQALDRVHIKVRSVS